MRNPLTPVLVLTVWCAAAPSLAQDATGTFFRIFLTDGTTLTSYGDFARVAERVVFSLPLGELQGQPRLHLASIPAEQVDWDTTERYREATRAAQYAETRGDEDFAVLSADVAPVLNDIGLTEDPHKRLSLAREARAQLAAWPAEHFGYRADEIRQILNLVDEVISDLRAATGESRFDLSLVAGVATPPQVTPLPPPSLQESILQALWAARFSASPPERRALLEAALGTLDVHASTLPVGWVTATRRRATEALDREALVDARITALRVGALASAERFAARADVRALERVVQDVRSRVSSFQAERPHEVQALLETLEMRLDGARRLRLALDQWELKADALKKYERAVSRQLQELSRGRPALDDIRTLAGPPVETLSALDKRLARVIAQLSALAVPPDGQPVHAVLTSAVQLASNAVRLRRTAIVSGNLQQAWDASAAAAGALLLLDRGREDVTRLVQPPRLP